MDLEEQLGARIRYLRQWKGLTQEDVSRESKLRRSYLSQIERGRFSARIDTLYLIAKALRVSLAELFENLG